MEDGSAVPDAHVLLQDGPTERVTSTNAIGEFSFSGISAGPAQLRVETECCTSQIHDVQIPVGDTPAKIDVNVWKQNVMPGEPTRILWGQTYDARTGTPLPWVRVGAAADSTYFETASREDGTYFLELPQGTIPIVASRVDTLETRFEIGANGDERVVIPVYLGQANVKVKLTAPGSADAVRLSDCDAAACSVPPSTSPDERFGFSEIMGASHFGVAAGFSYSAAKVLPGVYELTASGDARTARNTLEILPGQTWELEARLQPERDDRVVLSGTVLDETTRQPLEGILVDIRNEPRGQHTNGLQTDAHGRFSTMVAPGAVRLTIQPYDNTTRARYGYTYDPVHQTFALPVARDLTVLVPRTHTWEGTSPSSVLGWIVDSSTNSGIAGATIQIRNEGTYEWGDAVAGADGSFRFTVQPGRYTLAATGPGRTWSLTSFDVANETTWQNLTLIDPACCGDQDQGGWYGTLIQPSYYIPGRSPTTATPSPTTSTAPSKTSPTVSPLPKTESSRASQTPIRGSGVAMYAGAAGGLGPYHPADANYNGSTQDADDPAESNPVPAPVAALIAVSLAVAAGLYHHAGRRRPEQGVHGCEPHHQSDDHDGHEILDAAEGVTKAPGPRRVAHAAPEEALRSRTG